MTNEEIKDNLGGDFYNIDKAMDAARKDEAIAFGEWLRKMGMIDFKGMWIQAAGNSTRWTTEQLYELFKKQK